MLALLFLATGLFLSQDRAATRFAAKTAVQQGTKLGGLEGVIKLLRDMLTEFNKFTKEDKENWEAYSKWSGDEETDRKAFIQEQEGVVMSSTAQLNANKEAAATLTSQLADLASEIASIEESIKELVQLRTDEHKAHQEDLADLSKTIEATNKAIEVLEGHYAAAGSAALEEIKHEVLKSLSTLALAGRVTLGPRETSLLQDPNWLATDGGAAYGEYKGVAAESGGVVGTLKSIRTTLLDNKQASIEKENEARRQYEDAKAAKESDLKRNLDEQTAKANSLEEAKANIQHFTSTISQAQIDIKEAQDYVQLLLANRAKFEEEFTKRAQMREAEVTATQAGLDALQEVSVSFLQASASSALSSRFVMCPRCSKAVQQLLQVGSQSHSAALVQVGTAMEAQLKNRAGQPQAFFDPEAMAPVTNLLKQLIGRLEDELAAETSHHEWCETEKASSAAAKAEREKNIEELTAEIDQLTTKIQQLTSEITFLHSELVRVQQETDAAIRLRKDEKATYEDAKKEHDTVISALEKAMQALSSQYALLQTKAKVVVAAHGKQSPFGEYSSGSASGGNAIDMLQDLLNRYSAARTELVEAEEMAVAAHEQLLEHNEQFRKDTQQSKQAKETEKRQASERLGNAKLELAANRKELSEVVQYIADLRPSCDDIRSTFEERKKRREAEIAALKETLAVLEDPSMMR
jgi:chromosome segregation ATPase